MKACYAIALAAVLSACATHPDKIQPASYSGDCTAADRKRLASLVEEQKKTARNDTVGVILLGLPVGSMSGKDHEKEIAKLKAACGT